MIFLDDGEAGAEQTCKAFAGGMRMSAQLDVRIDFVNRENATFGRSQWLDGLQLELRRRQLDCKVQKQPAPENTMSLGFTEYLAIMEMILGAISMLIDELIPIIAAPTKNRQLRRGKHQNILAVFPSGQRAAGIFSGAMKKFFRHGIAERSC